VSKAENYRVEKKEILGVMVSITSYKIGERFHCHVANIDPGATIARAEGDTSEEAEQLALNKAKERLAGRESA
jgi:hypothetical protein